jgi:hypothetical protein
MANQHIAADSGRIAAKPRSDGFVAVGDMSELDQSAGKLQVQVSDTQLIVVGNASQSQKNWGVQSYLSPCWV